MPRLNVGENRNYSRLPLPASIPEGVDCWQVFAPRGQYWNSLLIGALYRLGQQVWYQRDENYTAVQVANAWDNANARTLENGLTPCGSGVQFTYDFCVKPVGLSWRYENGVLIIEYREAKNVCATINVYENGCGCGGSGCGCGGSNGGGLVDAPSQPPSWQEGASGSGDYNGAPTLCDALGALTAYIPDAVDDFIGLLQTGAIPFDWASVNLNMVVNSIQDSLTQIETELTDPDFVALLQKNIVKSFNDPWTPIARQDLRNFAYRMPPAFEGAPMWAAFVLWAEVANLNQLNKAVLDAAGTGDYEGTCALVFNSVGRTPLNPSDITPPLPDFTEIVLLNDSGIPNLKLYIAAASGVLGQSSLANLNIPAFDVLSESGQRVYSGGAAFTNNTFELNYSLQRYNGGQGASITGAPMLGVPSTGIISGASALTEATKSEVANYVNEYFGVTPLFVNSITPQNIDSGDGFRISVNAISGDVGTIEATGAFLVVGDIV